MEKFARVQSPLIDEPGEISVVDRGRTEQPLGSVWVTARLLWRNRVFFRRLVVRVVVVTTVMVFLIPSRYTSTTKIMPPDSAQSGMAMLAAMTGKQMPGLASLANDLVGGKNTGALFVGLLASRTVEDRLIERFDLRKVYRDRYWEDARKDLRKRTDISEDRKSGILTIQVTDNDRQRAAALAQAYVEELNRLLAQVSTSSARQERAFIEDRLKTVKLDLDRAEKAFSEFASKNSALDIKEQTRAMVASTAQLQGELIAAESQMQGLQQIYTPNNVRVKSLAARINELRRQLTKISGTESDPAGADHSGNELYPSIRKLPLLGVEWTDLYRQVKVQETVYELLTQRYEMARIEEAKETPIAKVADHADVPEKKSSPQRFLFVLLTAVGAVVLGAIWLTYRERWQETDSQDPRKLLVSEIWCEAKDGVGRLTGKRQQGEQVWNAKLSQKPPRNGNSNGNE